MCISELLRALCARKIHNNYDDMNYSKLIAAIDDRIRANGRREITGQTLHDVLEAMVRSLGAGYQVAGVLGPDDDPGEPDQRFAWLASEAGVYRHCGGVSVTELSWLIWGGGQWLVKPLDVPFGASVREWIADAVAEERSRALIAEALLQEGLDKEVSDRTEAVAAEARDRKAADAEEKAAREKAVADERARAEGAEQANAAAIAKEASDRAEAVKAEETRAQAALVSGTNIKTVNGESLLGPGDLAIREGLPTIKAGEGQYSEIFNAGGSNTSTASGEQSHAEGYNTNAKGRCSHAEGGGSSAWGEMSHAEGYATYAADSYCHTEGRYTVARCAAGHAEGRSNTGQSDSIHEVGIGTDNVRKDAHRITRYGKHYIPGVGNFTGVETSQQIASGGVKDLATVISELESAGGGGGPFALTLTLGTGDKWSMDCTFAELAAAVDAKRGVIFTMSGGSYDGNAFTATIQLHSSNVVVIQGYVNKACIYVVVTNGTDGLTVDVSDVNLVNINATIPTAPSNENVPGTKAIKDYVDGKCEPCVLQIYNSPEAGVEISYNIVSGELSPDSVIVIDINDSSDRRQFNVFGFRKIPESLSYGYVLSRTGAMVKVTFDLEGMMVTFDGDDI